ncbi:MAG: hypothetical protein LBV18_03245 [Alistipes sp.]|jgi:predicted Na+-dependent transporter|nr:hypothetical protein [Alistipes sp.]
MSRNDLQTILMPIAMVTGGVLHDFVARLNFTTPWMIFAMLFIPFCGARVRELRLSGLHGWMIAFQVVVAVAIYLVISIFDEDIAQGAMICVLAPTATAAVVIASMLGARISTMISYSLVVNVVAAVAAPLFFSLISASGGVPVPEIVVASLSETTIISETAGTLPEVATTLSETAAAIHETASTGATTIPETNILSETASTTGASFSSANATPSAAATFWDSFVTIFLRVIPVIVLPLAAALTLRLLAPRAADFVARLKPVSFYIWVASLVVVSGSVVDFIAQQRDLTLGKGLAMAGIALTICVLQFFVGRWIGARYGEKVAGGQALGQKNTILAIWLAQTYLNPVSSIAPAAYVLWQNLFNSVQLWQKNRRDK